MSKFLIKAAKFITVSNNGIIHNGGMIIEDGLITHIGYYDELKEKIDPSTSIIDYGHLVITPGLVDCHTHLLEFAPSSLYPITKETQELAAKAILLKTLSSGITALGEQICGSPMLHSNITELKKSIVGFPLLISFATTSISIGLDPILHFTSATGSVAISKEDLVKPAIVKVIAENSEFAGENVFINATPANFTKDLVPNAGEIIYSQEELNTIVSIYHSLNKKVGTHVAGEKGIEMALHANFDVLHHAHGITDEQMKKVAKQNKTIVATPLGGTHLPPNSVEEVLKMVQLNIPIAISSDGYLPPHENTVTFPKLLQGLIGPDSLMTIAHPFLKALIQNGFDENKALSLITLNPAKVLEKDHLFGSLEVGKEANFIVADGIPGIEIVDIEQVKAVYYKGVKMIERK